MIYFKFHLEKFGKNLYSDFFYTDVYKVYFLIQCSRITIIFIFFLRELNFNLSYFIQAYILYKVELSEIICNYFYWFFIQRSK